MNSMNKESGSGGSQQYRAFKQVIIWSLLLFAVLVAFGFLYRVIVPVELHLDESEYIKKVFTEYETEARAEAGNDAPAAGLFDGGSILYVIEVNEDTDSYLVRPFAVSPIDRVWISRSDAAEYSDEAYRQWQYDEEQRRFGLDE
jgi:hypothetical protein